MRSAVRLAEGEAGVEGTDPALRSNRSMSMKTSAGLQDSGTDTSDNRITNRGNQFADAIEVTV